MSEFKEYGDTNLAGKASVASLKIPKVANGGVIKTKRNGKPLTVKMSDPIMISNMASSSGEKTRKSSPNTFRIRSNKRKSTTPKKTIEIDLNICETLQNQS